MSRVFVTQVPSFRSGSGWTPKHDLKPAEAFGALEVMLQPGNVQVTPKALDRAAAQMRAALWNFDERDYLLLLGDPVLCALAMAVLTRYHPEVRSVSLLKWDRLQAAYIPVVLNV